MLLIMLGIFFNNLVFICELLRFSSAFEVHASHKMNKLNNKTDSAEYKAGGNASIKQ